MRDATSGPSRPAAGAGRFVWLVCSFWVGERRALAWTLTVLLAIVILSGVALQSIINSWNALFFDALEKKAGTEIGPLLGRFALYVLAAGIVMMATILVRMSLQITLRKWLTGRIVARWLGSGAYHRLTRHAKGAETPEFRIADDVRLAVDQLVDLAVGFTSAVLLAVTFFAVLARVGGAIHVEALGITVPAYFLVGAVIYAVLMSGFASLLGWPLVQRIATKNHLEGVFRYELMRVRENSGAINAQRGAEAERGLLQTTLDDLIAGWRRVVVGQSQVSGIASSNAVLVGVFPVILAIPKYISGEMSLGAVMQIATAFVQVQMALNWIVDNFMRVAEFKASANRVGELMVAMDAVEGTGLERGGLVVPAALADTPDADVGAAPAALDPMAAAAPAVANA